MMIGFTTLTAHKRRWHRQRDVLFTLQQITDRDLWDFGAKRADLPLIAGDMALKARR
jgi:uncharacterized protein YjiS (DUF1127 family)